MKSLPPDYISFGDTRIYVCVNGEIRKINSMRDCHFIKKDKPKQVSCAVKQRESKQ